MSDGWLRVLTDAGYEVRHEKGTESSYSRRDEGTVRTLVLKDGVEVLRQEQKLRSVGKIYREVAESLGLAKPYKYCPPQPLDLKVTEESGPPHGNIRFEHPSFGVITLSRYTGGHKHFGSPINTQGGMGITIHSASLRHNVDLGTDDIWPDKPLAEVYLSFTQFAEFITSHGAGEGTPCTIAYMDGEVIQPCEMPTYEERLEANARKSMDDAVQDIAALATEIEQEMSGPGGLTAGRKREIWGKLRQMIHAIDGKPQWLMRMWREHLDNTMVHARSEFRRFAEQYIGRHEELWRAISGGRTPDALPAQNLHTDSSERTDG